MTPDNSLAREVAAQLIAHQTPGSISAGAAADVVPVAGAIRLAVVELSRWVGPDGCRALLLRALSGAAREHPALGTIKVISHSAPVLAGVDESIEASGAPAIAAGLATTLVGLFELLGRLIGDELTMRLAEQMTAGATSGAAQLETQEGNHDSST